VLRYMTDFKVLERKHLVPLNFFEDPATIEAIQEVIGHIVPLAQHNAPGNAGNKDPAKEEVIEVGPGGTQLEGAVNHGMQRRVVPWIWLGGNLKPGENNGDPAGVSTCHSNGRIVLMCIQLFIQNGRGQEHEHVAGVKSWS
jgi:hypothetical protein